MIPWRLAATVLALVADVLAARMGGGGAKQWYATDSPCYPDRLRRARGSDALGSSQRNDVDRNAVLGLQFNQAVNDEIAYLIGVVDIYDGFQMDAAWVFR